MKTNWKDTTKKAWAFAKENKVALLQMAIMTAAVIPADTCFATYTATEATLPWKSGMQTLTKELTGPLPKAGAVIACAASGAMLAFGETQGLTKKAIQATFGAGIALGSPSMVQALSGDSSVTGLFF